MDFVNAADFEEYARKHLPKQVCSLPQLSSSNPIQSK